MSPLVPPTRPTPSAEYFLDMIDELAKRAREIGEVEAALHLEATAAVRRHALNRLREAKAT